MAFVNTITQKHLSTIMITSKMAPTTIVLGFFLAAVAAGE